MRRFSFLLLGCSVFAASSLRADEPVARPRSASAALSSANAAVFEDVSVARAKAVAENRPLMILVGGKSAGKDVVAAFPNAVHCQCDSFHGSTDSRLLIPAGEGSYTVFDNTQISPANFAEIRSVVERAPVSTTAAQHVTTTQHATTSSFAAQPVTTQFATGGCANGQCGVPSSHAVRSFAAPASGGCANGQCGAPRGFFRRR